MKNSLIKTFWHALAAVCLGAFSLGAQAQALQVSTESELRAAPALDARVLMKLAPGTEAQQTGSQGGWIKVKVQNQEGWVRLTHVKAMAPAPAQAANPITGLAGMFSANSNRPTATTGTRGLTQEQLANAQPAPAEVQLLERYATSGAQAEQHAKSGRLAAQRIEPYTEADR
ncbi:MAG TPA: SH3 domain-containing protein [Burkholderiaceae bacterium]|nr:SH3 domain-containing protein [Burkholderiaceae bacterium]